MELQYVSDNEGRPTAVLIPIAEWNNITAKHEDLKELEKPRQGSSKGKPSDYVGCISKETALKMISDIEQSRNDWERNF
ncbi:hypothetical protein [Mucilaginibacter sp. L3T2-6]|uniref:hypothetical protein n=1 Tax=Mucilaginibacter sp. L3T2-6 TaxID=3062491 RepID=UPI0026748865|nr:hypothetical protein [Mucilaginibacter sp. L3T2-6]MDO3644510.1 hypothetical protein [Mucilaginibacter sp. L3T2-6]MDV6216962.1 hypothetical protein [Mucilaginibacter sp. L3T2-6]